MERLEYWNKYYDKRKYPDNPSDFAKFCLEYLDHWKEVTLLDIGCGNGRDSYFFAYNGLNVIGVDNSDIVQSLKVRDNVKFFQSDVSSLANQKVDYVYARFFLHAITQEEEDILFKWIAENLNKGGLFLSESRTINDELYNKPSDHYRRFLDKDALVKRLEGHGFKINYVKEDTGFAPLYNEDPKLVRIVAEK